MELALEDGVNLVDLINSVMSTAVGLVKDKNIRLEKDIDQTLPLVRADTTRLRQVLINLFSNAAKFTDEGMIKITAGTQPGEDGWPEVVISVQDTGIGIAQEDQNMLFLPFSQVDASPTRKTGGSGLGLSISRHLIEMHNGRIGVESVPGKGSKFFFTLPVPVSHPPIHLGSNDRVVLTVDDEPQILNLYERYLSNRGYQVVPLTDPSKVVNVARHLQPFAITLDIMMPGANGWEVLENINSDPATRSIPVIICSVADQKIRAKSLGATDYLLKPILEDDLVNALEKIKDKEPGG